MLKSNTVIDSNFKTKQFYFMFFQTLVAETLVLAKTHGYVEKIEDELEQELARDIRPPPAERLNRFVLFKAHCLAYPHRKYRGAQMHSFEN